MAEAFLSRRIGERWLAVMEADRLVEMRLSRDDDGAAAGSLYGARLKTRLGQRGIALLESGEEVLVEPWPAGFAEGVLVEIRISRQRWREPGRDRLAKAKGIGPAKCAGLLEAAPDFDPVSAIEAWPDEVAESWDAGWQAAELGRVVIPGGSLNFTPTPAFVAVDIDGTGARLAVDAARALAQTIRLWRIGGGIAVDFPVQDRASRQAVAEAFDAAMGDTKFERTAVNGFGLLHVILPRTGPSILERARFETTATAGLALLNRAVHEPRPGPLTLVARPKVVEWIRARPALLATANRRAGRTLDLKADVMAGEGHVETSAQS
ncbi:MAG: hypothetical protein WCZ66_00560 [Sphingomonadaceae bacterium]